MDPLCSGLLQYSLLYLIFYLLHYRFIPQFWTFPICIHAFSSIPSFKKCPLTLTSHSSLPAMAPFPLFPFSMSSVHTGSSTHSCWMSTLSLHYDVLPGICSDASVNIANVSFWLSANSSLSVFDTTDHPSWSLLFSWSLWHRTPLLCLLPLQQPLICPNLI